MSNDPPKTRSARPKLSGPQRSVPHKAVLRRFVLRRVALRRVAHQCPSIQHKRQASSYTILQWHSAQGSSTLSSIAARFTIPSSNTTANSSTGNTASSSSSSSTMNRALKITMED